jgi:CNT family concentrative nucleoside transporter
MEGEVGLKVQGGIGVLAILGLCFLLSTNRGSIRPRIVVLGLAMQFLFAFVVLRTELGRRFFEAANAAVLRLLEFSQAGMDFVFGPLAVPPGSPASLGFLFAVHALVPIIFFASLMAVLYHLGIMQFVVKCVAFLVQRSLKTSGAETLSAAANIFVGQTEAPLLVKPFIAKMTRSEMMAVMTGGFATVAGGVMAAYVGMVRGEVPDIAGHLLTASVMAAPAGLMIAKILVPETERSETADSLDVKVERTSRNVIDAAASGASEGMMLVLNVAAMLVAFISLIALLDFLLGLAGGLAGYPELSLGRCFQYAFAPLAWLMGIESGDRLDVAGLLGTKLVATEFTAFLELGRMNAESDVMSERSIRLVSYALCGFANFASIAIQIGGIGALAPSRRSELAALGLKAMFAGFLTTCLTATVAGILL